jgi:raw score 8.27
MPACFILSNFDDWGWIAVYGVVMQCMAWGMIAYAIPLLSL